MDVDEHERISNWLKLRETNIGRLFLGLPINEEIMKTQDTMIGLTKDIISLSEESC